jgi:hypothetical protein
MVDFEFNVGLYAPSRRVSNTVQSPQVRKTDGQIFLVAVLAGLVGTAIVANLSHLAVMTVTSWLSGSVAESMCIFTLATAALGAE